jgi:hypothetical protein
VHNRKTGSLLEVASGPADARGPNRGDGVAAAGGKAVADLAGDRVRCADGSAAGDSLGDVARSAYAGGHAMVSAEREPALALDALDGVRFAVAADPDRARGPRRRAAGLTGAGAGCIAAQAVDAVAGYAVRCRAEGSAVPGLAHARSLAGPGAVAATHSRSIGGAAVVSRLPWMTRFMASERSAMKR